MPLVRLEDVHKHYGAQRVLEGATGEIEPGEKVGLIGRNGGGKSTLVRILTGDLEPDVGAVHRQRGLRIGYLPQVPDLAPGNSVRDEALRGFADVFALEHRLRELEHAMAEPADDAALARLIAEHGEVQHRFEQADGYTIDHRVDAALMGLGFAAADFAKPVAALSGGEKNRLALARLLASGPDLLVLDEPTNFLDLATTVWLEEFLRAAPQAVLVVAHDRYFLDRVVGRVWEVDHATVTPWRGNYSAYLRQRAERELTQQRAYDNQQAYIAKEEEFIRRFIAGQRHKEAEGRRTKLARLERIEAPRRAPVLDIRLGEPGRSSWQPLEARGLAKRYGDRTLFRELDVRVEQGARLAIIGPNGAGKTTLLRILRGQEPADAGEVRWGHGVKLAWYEQEQRDLDLGADVLSNVQAARPTMTDEGVRTFLGALLFTEDEVFKRVGDLSGGERSRVALARLLLQPHHCLVLDEPTNHLDVASRDALESALLQYAGTLIFVSHDRYLIDRLATDLLILGPEVPQRFAGNYTQWRQTQERAARAAEAEQSPPPQRRAARPAARPSSKPTRGPKRRPLEAIEADVIAAEEAVARCHRALQDPDAWRDGDKMRALQGDLAAAQSRLAALETEWESRARE